MKLTLLALVLMSYFMGCSHSAYNSKTELTKYPDGRVTITQQVGVGTISFLAIKDVTLNEMVLTDGSQLNQATSHTDPDEAAIAETKSSLTEWLKILITLP